MQNLSMEAIKQKFENPANERLVLSCVLQNPGLMLDLSSKISEKDFLSPHHRALYSVLNHIYTSGLEGFDIMALVSYASEMGVLETVGGADYISVLMHAYVNPANFSTYIEKLLDNSLKYTLYVTTLKVQETILENVSGPGAKPSEELLSAAESSIVQIALDAKKADDAIDIGLGLESLIEELKVNPKKIVGLSSGIKLVDELINGFTPGSLSVFAARAKAGKSTLLMNIASHMAYKLKVPVLYIDTEMTTNEVQYRALSHMSGVNHKRIVNGEFALDDRECNLINKALHVINEGSNFYHRFYPGFNDDVLVSTIKKYAIKYGIKAFIFDYIKLSESSLTDNSQEYLKLGQTTSKLKDIAGELGIAGLSAVQLNRGAVGKSRVTEADIAGSDRIVHYCSNLFALSRKTTKEIEEEGGYELCGTHTLQLLACRAGSSFYEGINLMGRLTRCTFEEAQVQVYGAAGND